MKTRITRLAALAAALLATVLLPACGSSSSQHSGTSHGQQANAVDHAFVQQMIPHHKMAVQMARMAQMQGQHPQIKTLAADIITAQEREITEMTGIAAKLGVKPDQMPKHGSTGGHMMSDDQTLGVPMEQTGMSMDMGMLDGAKPFDRTFIDMMIPHHQGAIRMARAELAKGVNPQLRTIARAIVGDQAKEIGQMNAWRTQWFGAPSPAGGVPKA